MKIIIFVVCAIIVISLYQFLGHTVTEESSAESMFDNVMKDFYKVGGEKFVWETYAKKFFNAYISDKSFIKKKYILGYDVTNTRYDAYNRYENSLYFQYNFWLSVKKHFCVNYIIDNSMKYDFFKYKFAYVRSENENKRTYIKFYKDMPIEDAILSLKENFFKKEYWKMLFNKTDCIKYYETKTSSELELEGEYIGVNELTSKLDNGEFDYLLKDNYRFVRMYRAGFTVDHKYTEFDYVVYDLKDKIYIVGYTSLPDNKYEHFDYKIKYVEDLIDNIDKTKYNVMAYALPEMSLVEVELNIERELLKIIKEYGGTDKEETYVKGLYKRYEYLAKKCDIDNIMFYMWKKSVNKVYIHALVAKKYQSKHKDDKDSYKWTWWKNVE